MNDEWNGLRSNRIYMIILLCTLIISLVLSDCTNLFLYDILLILAQNTYNLILKFITLTFRRQALYGWINTRRMITGCAVRGYTNNSQITKIDHHSLLFE